MNFKAMILLTRRNDMSHAEFEQWWLNTHVSLARQLPGLRRAVFNVVTDPQENDPDGITELWFDSQAAFEAAYDTEIGQRVVADSLANVSSRRRMFVTEHFVAGD
jgi:uncharacterized protein (TIGR02118 family)